MGKNLLVGIGGKARHVKALYVGVGGKARKVKKIYVGVGGKARLVYQSYIPVTGITYSHVDDSNYNDLWIYFKVNPSNATNPAITFTKNSNQIRFTTSNVKPDANGYVYIRCTTGGAMNTSVWTTVTCTSADGKSASMRCWLYLGEWHVKVP